MPLKNDFISNTFARSGGVAAITAFLSCPETRVLFISVTTIHNILLHMSMEDEFRERGKEIIRQQGGVQNMVWVLQVRISNIL